MLFIKKCTNPEPGCSISDISAQVTYKEFESIYATQPGQTNIHLVEKCN